MNASFNVLDDPWIPVICSDGSRELLGIRETLRRATELKEISAVSPLEEFAIYRFLSVFLMDALRPMDRDYLEQLFLEYGVFDLEQIEAYCSLCKKNGVSFDLFDEKRPFMQVIYDAKVDKEPQSISRLDFALPNGNNHTHFEHPRTEPIVFSCADAFRKLLVNYIFITQGGAGYSPSINGTPPYMILVNGNTLFETLCFQMVPLEEQGDVEDATTVWMQYQNVGCKKEVTTVPFLRSMMFPVRRIKLVPDGDGKTVSSVYYNPGYKYSGGDAWTDPNVAYARNKDGERYAVKPELTKDIWRNYTELIRKENRPKVIDYSLRYTNGANITITLYGLEADQASCENLLRHSLYIPKPLLENGKAECLTTCIRMADTIEQYLKYALRMALQNEKENATKKQKKKENAQVNEVVGIFFSRCEVLFWELVQTLTKQQEPDEMESTQKTWKKDIFAIAVQEYRNAVSSIRVNGKALRQIVSGERILHAWDKKAQKKGGSTNES